MKAVLTLSKTFFKDHFREGKETFFKGKVSYGQKIHTCRGNYDYWKGQIDKVTSRSGTLSIREWIDKPYRSKQQVIKEVPAEVVGVQKLNLSRRNMALSNLLGPDITAYAYEYAATIDGVKVPLELLAENDGLSKNEFIDWFKPAFKRFDKEQRVKVSDWVGIEFAVIHFTNYRY